MLQFSNVDLTGPVIVRISPKMKDNNNEYTINANASMDNAKTIYLTYEDGKLYPQKGIDAQAPENKGIFSWIKNSKDKYTTSGLPLRFNVAAKDIKKTPYAINPKLKK